MFHHFKFTRITESVETQLGAGYTARKSNYKNHTIYFVHFCSMELMDELMKERIYGGTTVRTGRQLQQKDLHKDNNEEETFRFMP